MTRERDIQRAILYCLRVHGLRAERLNSGAASAEYNGRRRYVRFTFAGCPDIVALLPDGRTLWVEVKRPGGKLSPEQARFAADCRQRGVPHIVADSVEATNEYVRALRAGAA